MARAVAAAVEKGARIEHLKANVPEGHVWVYKALCFPSWTASAERASVRAELNCAQAWHSLQAGILWVYGIRN